MAEEMVKVRFHEDGDHLWIRGRQFISLERFLTVKRDQNVETRLLADRVKELTEENEALTKTIKVLTK